MCVEEETKEQFAVEFAWPLICRPVEVGSVLGLGTAEGVTVRPPQPSGRHLPDPQPPPFPDGRP